MSAPQPAHWEEAPEPKSPDLRVLPNPIAPDESEPPPLPGHLPGAQTTLPQNRGHFLAPEEVDMEAGFREQEALEAATESHAKGILGGGLAALACTLLAGGFAALTGYWYGLLSIGIGFAVAFGVRKLGRGNSPQFGVIGAAWALAGCLGAYHFACAIVFAREMGVSLLDFIAGIESWGSFMEAVLGPKDFFFYAIATYCGYKYSYDAVADQY